MLLNMETTRESLSIKVSILISTLSWTGQLSAKVSVMKWGDWETDTQRDSDQITYDDRNLTHSLWQSAKNGQDLVYESQHPYFFASVSKSRPIRKPNMFSKLIT